MKKWLYIVLIAIFFSTPALGEEKKSAAVSSEASRAEVRAFVDRSTVTIGEKITYTVEVDTEEGVQIEYPAYAANLGGFAVRDFGRREAEKSGRGRVKSAQWFVLDTYTVGPYVIPSQEIQVKLPDGRTETLKSPEIFVDVKSVMTDAAGTEGKEELKDIKAPLNIERKFPLLWIVLGVLGVSAAAGSFFWASYRKRHMKKVAPAPVPPHQVAFEELNRIEGLDLIRRREIKEYYYLVSNCLRTYLENRFALKAPEQTTPEFLESVMNGNVLEGRFINILKEYLERCDLVKYAKLEPPADEITKLLEITRRFIEETRTRDTALEGSLEPALKEARAS